MAIEEVSMSETRLFVVGTFVVTIATLAFAGAAAVPLSGTSIAAAASLQAQEDKVVKVGGKVKPPRKIKHVDPVYPPEARDAGIQGVVALQVIVGRDGLVKSADVVKSVPELDQAALEAVRQWEFEPTYVDGETVAVEMTITINFTLE